MPKTEYKVCFSGGAKSNHRSGPIQTSEITTSTEAKHKMRAKISRLRRQSKDSLIAKIIQLKRKVEKQNAVENALRDEVIEMSLQALTGSR